MKQQCELLVHLGVDEAEPFHQAVEAPEETREYARKNLSTRLDYLQRTIGSKPFLAGEQYTVADPYLFTVLGWGVHVNVDLGRWPELKRYVERIGQRPQVIEALKSERPVK